MAGRAFSGVKVFNLYCVANPLIYLKYPLIQMNLLDFASVLLICLDSFRKQAQYIEVVVPFQSLKIWLVI
jgi:hypothetical protein